jgi:TRAP-type uncharacterized transport system substrate-binding protein
MRTSRMILLAFGLACAVPPAAAQDSEARALQQQQRAAQAERDSYREQVNENVLFLMSGQPDDSYVALAHDIAVVVDDGLRLRVLPVIGNAAVQNVSDVVFLRGIDLAFTTTQVMSHLKQTKQYGANLDRQIVYVAALSNDDMHVLARPGINAIEDLNGKKVNFHTTGSSTALLSPLIFKGLRIDVRAVNMPQADAIEKMRTGEIDATVCICPKPVNILTQLKEDTGFKLLDVPFVPGFHEDYLPSSISRDDYPALLPKSGKVETIATTTVLISFNWPRGSNRYNRTVKFVEALFSKFSELQRPPRHPMWRSVNLAAVVPGWQRFAAAQEWLDRNQRQTVALRANLAKVLEQQPLVPGVSTAADNDRLFREFMDYMRKTRN